MWANTGFRVLSLSKKLNREVHLPADLKGIKIRVTTSKVAAYKDPERKELVACPVSFAAIYQREAARV